MTGWPRKVRKTVGTWDMTPEELARIVAEHLGWYGSEGGWIYDARGRVVIQGWSNLAARLTRAGWIVPGKGVAWARLPQPPTSLWDGHPRRRAAS